MRTIGDMLTEVVACTTEEQAQDLVLREIAETLQNAPSLLPEQARDMVMKNIGYLSGYCGRTEAGRILKLFGARHPYFGAIEDWPTDPAELMDMGRRVALLALQRGDSLPR